MPASSASSATKRLKRAETEVSYQSKNGYQFDPLLSKVCQYTASMEERCELSRKLIRDHLFPAFLRMQQESQTDVLVICIDSHLDAWDKIRRATVDTGGYQVTKLTNEFNESLKAFIAVVEADNCEELAQLDAMLKAPRDTLQNAMHKALSSKRDIQAKLK